MGFKKRQNNKEEYKGFYKLFPQWSNCAALLCLVAVLAAALILPAPASASYVSGGVTFNSDSSSVILNQGVDTAIKSPIATLGVFNVSFFRQSNAPVTVVDTKYAVIADSSISTIIAVYGDTLAVVNGDATVYAAADTGKFVDTVYITTDTAKIGDILDYTLWVTNHANASDTLGLIVDSAWINGSTAQSDTTAQFRYQFFNKNGSALTSSLSAAHQETALVGLASNASGTALLRVTTTGTSNSDSVRLAVRAYANNASGRIPGTTREVAPYQGFNKIEYGGDGNAATFIEVVVSGPLIRAAKSDTVFAPVALSGGASDTQRYVPGAMIVYTIWFDNDGTDTADTIVVEDWLDTRHLRFDSAGLSPYTGVAQIAAAETYVGRGYGNIFTDSAMPRFATDSFGVRIEYVNTAGAWTNLTSATPLESVARIRWTIYRPGGVVGTTNGDNLNTIDSEPIAPTAAGDRDMGFVRFSAVIR